ncbi:MAG: Type II secretion system protein E [Parcubacteria group bacterium GW2011_GWA2_51_10]|nr:MAG: Type II secretion system protein E [Parcubacteria group bacterium GW2011_GWA2_51_10]
MSQLPQFNEQKQDERLHELRAREEEQLAEMLSGKYGVEYIDLTTRSVDTDALRLIPEKSAREAEVAAFRKINKRILVAMRAPERPDAVLIMQNLERLGYRVERFIASHNSLEHAWERYKDH